jgi:FKBP-type peptidyl-prolyl cis-trans isomerase
LIPDETLIEGWSEGVKLMRDEEDGILIIPYDLAYGQEGLKDANGNWIVPPYMTLVFYMSVEAD